ncbi:MAG: beta-ketoacyl synthase N-terminal-like domain-containing protein, partial [Thermodesulfobacteriota bacterium]
MRIAIQGLGAVGGFGCGHLALQSALEKGRSPLQSVSIRTAQGVSERPAFLADTAGLEKYVNKKSLRRIDHYAKLALLGAYLTLDDAGQLETNPRPGMGSIIASGYGATRTTFAFLDSFLDNGDKFSSPTHFSSSVHNAAVAYVTMFLGLTG